LRPRELPRRAVKRQARRYFAALFDERTSVCHSFYFSFRAKSCPSPRVFFSVNIGILAFD
jgi:hypothetical protein